MRAYTDCPSCAEEGRGKDPRAIMQPMDYAALVVNDDNGLTITLLQCPVCKRVALDEESQ